MHPATLTRSPRRISGRCLPAAPDSKLTQDVGAVSQEDEVSSSRTAEVDVLSERGDSSAGSSRWHGRPIAPWTSAALIVLALISLASGVRAALGDVEEHDGALWDLDYYRRAAASWFETGDPYLVSEESGGYFYSPIVTPALARIFRDFEADRWYVALVAAAALATLWLALRAARPPRPVIWLCAIYALAFANGEGIQLLVTGNLAWLVALVQAGALLAAARGRWPIFYLLVGLGCLVKPYTLALLVVPFVLRTLSPWAALACAPAVADLLGGALLWPGLAESRMTAIRLQVIEPLQLRYTLAGRLSRLLADLGLDAEPATMLAVTVQLGIAAGLALYLRRRPTTGTDGFAMAAVAALSAIPRQVGYDAIAFGPLLFVALWTFTAAPGSRRVDGLLVATLAIGLFKEGLVVLPLLVVALLLTARAAESS